MKIDQDINRLHAMAGYRENISLLHSRESDQINKPFSCIIHVLLNQVKEELELEHERI
jgi:hypothetical protein